tara:strand:- start:3612 stop:3896 length:285 start_codon:yes stop_codon:yes gene_type:complete
MKHPEKIAKDILKEWARSSNSLLAMDFENNDILIDRIAQAIETERTANFTAEDIEIAFVVRLAMDFDMDGEETVPFVRDVIKQMAKMKAAYGKK